MRPDPVSIVSGAVVAALGAFVLLESTGALHVSLGWAAVVLSAAVGSILLLSGLLDDGDGERGRHGDSGASERQD